MSANSTTAINNVQNCPAYTSYVQSEALDFDTTLASIETFFDCSGICTKSIFYALTDLTR